MNPSDTTRLKGASKQPRSWSCLNEKGEREEVRLERFYWKAIYKDGTSLAQFGTDFIYHRVTEIDMDNLVELQVRDAVLKDRLIVLPVKKHQQMFFFYRGRKDIKVGAGKDEVVREIRSAVFGWKDRDTGSTCYNRLMPDGAHIVTSGDFKLN